MKLKLGLIGHAIAQSQAPRLHRMFGEIYGYDVTYDLIEPSENSADAFSKAVGRLRDQAYTACNVTFPFKQIAVSVSDLPDIAVLEIGSTNTLYLAESKLRATNTDFTGFIHAYRYRRGEDEAGDVLVLGAGGVGRAVAFGLTHLSVGRIYIYDTNSLAAETLVESLTCAGADAVTIASNEELGQVATKVDGLVNCSPIGHHKSPGIPLDPALFGGQKWAFDAVYIPLDTPFLREAARAGLTLISGFDLFFYQGVDAFRFFSRSDLDPQNSRARFVKRFKLSSDFVTLY